MYPLSSNSAAAAAAATYVTPSSSLSSSSSSGASLTTVCKTHDIAVVKSAIARGVLPDNETLNAAVESRKIEIVRAVIGAGAQAGYYTFLFAARVGNLEIANAIVGAGAQPCQYSLTGAFEGKNSDIIELACRLGARPDETTVDAALKFGFEHFKPSYACSLLDTFAPTKDSFMLAVSAHNPYRFDISELMLKLIEKGARADSYVGVLDRILKLSPHSCSIVLLEKCISLGAKCNNSTLHTFMLAHEGAAPDEHFFAVFNLLKDKGGAVKNEGCIASFKEHYSGRGEGSVKIAKLLNAMPLNRPISQAAETNHSPQKKGLRRFF